MTSKVLGSIIAAIVGVVFICVGGGAMLLTGSDACGLPTPDSSTLPSTRSSWPAVSGYRPDQVSLAATIVAVGGDMAIPRRGWVIAVATAIQESGLTNPDSGDQDSIGLFQQRPSQGWGTPQQLHDPGYATRAFYERLRTVPGWQQLPLSDAAQAVQHSAHPDAYSRWEPDAVVLVEAVSGLRDSDRSDAFLAGGGTCGGDGGDGQGGGDPITLPATWAPPAGTAPAVVAAILWALGQLGTPYQFGGDCTDPHSSVAAHHCDCSSLVQAAYRAGGVQIPRTTGEQIHAGIAVDSIAALLPGDLLFIPGSDGTPHQPGHVGLYLGDGLLIQAPHTGDVVKITNLSSWTTSISIIRRIA